MQFVGNLLYAHPCGEQQGFALGDDVLLNEFQGGSARLLLHHLRQVLHRHAKFVGIEGYVVAGAEMAANKFHEGTV